MARKRTLALVALFTIVACGQSGVPDPPLVRAYADVVVARYQVADSAAMQRAYDSIARHHGLQPEHMRRTLREMAGNRELQRAFYDSVAARLDSLRMESSVPDTR
jgi:predicted small lipoprotein YifL